MERNVGLALGDLKERLEKAKADPLQHSLIVTVVELDALVTWAEAQQAEIKEGDQVEVLIDYISVKKGMQGIVRSTKSNWEYPIEVQFPENSLGYWFDDDRVSFNAFELRKV
jgi:hypothetical protein